jgi:3-deoxy-D-manno-octulosonic-acid transferase
MELLYQIAVNLYVFFIHVAAFLGIEKARLWVNGRKNIFQLLENQLNKKSDNEIRVWFHVASLGEFEQGRPLIEALRRKFTPPQYPQRLRIILTFFSPSGYEIRKNYALADHIFYLPADSSSHAKRFLTAVQPDICVFVKYEFWHFYLKNLHQRNVKTLLISALFHERQIFFRWYGVFFKNILKNFTHIFVQNEISVTILRQHGFENVTKAGDTRIDRVLNIANEGKRFEEIERWAAAAPLLIVGSSWQPDEDILIKIINYNKLIDWKFIIAPHEIGENNLSRLEGKLTVSSVRYSQLRAATEGGKKAQISTVLIIDNIGMLSALYRYGKVAYIGGGFGRGIHNTLEPIAHGLPVVFGRKYKRFEEAVKLVEWGGAFAIENAEDAEKILLSLTHEPTRQQAATAAKRYILENQGATQLILDYFNNGL